MIQFLNNIWNALNSQNPELVSLLTLPLFPIAKFSSNELFSKYAKYKFKY